MLKVLIAFAIGNFLRDASEGQAITIAGDGTPRRSYLYSDDLVIWLLKILTDGKNLEPYNVGSDESFSILDVAQKVSSVINPKIEIKVLKAKDNNQPVHQYVPNVNKARQELNLQVWTSLESAISQSLNK